MAADREAAARLLASMAAEYRESLPGKLAEIETLSQALALEGLPTERMQTLQRLVHTLAGSAKTFGLASVTDTARALESVLDAIAAGGDGAAEDVLKGVTALKSAAAQSSTKSG